MAHFASPVVTCFSRVLILGSLIPSILCDTASDNLTTLLNSAESQTHVIVDALAMQALAVAFAANPELLLSENPLIKPSDSSHLLSGSDSINNLPVIDMGGPKAKCIQAIMLCNHDVLHESLPSGNPDVLRVDPLIRFQKVNLNPSSSPTILER